MRNIDPGWKDKVTAQLIADHLMRSLQGVDLEDSEFAHTMIERAFSILMEMTGPPEGKEPHDVYLALVCFMQELEVNAFPIFEAPSSGDSAIPTFAMKRSFIPMAASACMKGLANHVLQVKESDIRSVLGGNCLSLKGEADHPRTMTAGILSTVMRKS